MSSSLRDGQVGVLLSQKEFAVRASLAGSHTQRCLEAPRVMLLVELTAPIILDPVPPWSPYPAYACSPRFSCPQWSAKANEVLLANHPHLPSGQGVSVSPVRA